MPELQRQSGKRDHLPLTTAEARFPAAQICSTNYFLFYFYMQITTLPQVLHVLNLCHTVPNFSMQF